MPKKPFDYSTCCIYKLEHIENERLIYVGHTTYSSKERHGIKIIVIMKLIKN
jgi:hypothetical protein